MKTAKELLAIARRQIGNNGSKYRSYVGAGGSWCDMFVYWLYHANGCGALIPWKGLEKTYCPASIKWCRKNLAQLPPYLAMACDIIYFDWEWNNVPNHIGIVESRKSTTSVYTIEGNTSGGKVDDKQRATKYVQAIYRPHFVPNGLKRGKLEIDGCFEYKSIFMLQEALGILPTGVMTKSTVMALQKKVKVTPDGAWGKQTSKAVQKFLKIKADGDFGKASVMALQKWINVQCFKVTPVEPTPTPKPPVEKKGYQGTFPALPPKTAKLAVEYAYAYGTKLSVYRYEGGKPKDAYKKALNKAYPNRKRWKYAKSRAGASCDVFAGTDLKNSGYKSAPHQMSKMVSWCRKNLKKVDKMQNGDILTRTNHVMIVVDLKGKKYVANAHYQNHGGTYGIIEKVGSHTAIWRPDCPSVLEKGDKFTSVIHLQRFLNWYGNYGIKEDYIYGNKTVKAVEDFQKKEGLSVTGIFSAKDLEAAKKVRK